MVILLKKKAVVNLSGITIFIYIPASDVQFNISKSVCGQYVSTNTYKT